MKICLNKTGVALVLVLMIVVLSAGLLSAIMYYALSGTEISGLQRKYETSKEASLGVIDVFTKELIPRALIEGSLSAVVATITQGGGGIVNSIVAGSTNLCFSQKLTLQTTTNAVANWTSCTGSPTNPDPTVNPDITFNLLSVSGATRPFQVRAKIIDTVFGNSNMSGVALEGEGVVESGLGEITARHFPYLYTITVEGKLQSSTTERANFEILYAY
jgi:hypothetical protein